MKMNLMDMDNEKRFEILLKSNNISIAEKMTLQVLYYEHKKLYKALQISRDALNERGCKLYGDIEWCKKHCEYFEPCFSCKWKRYFLQKAGEEIEKPKLVQ